jgi:hypothetical protein
VASGVRVVWTGSREFSAALDRWVAREAAASRVAVNRASMALIRNAKKRATGPARTAKAGTVGARPGQGPGVVTGRLRNSITVTSKGPVGATGYQATVAPTVKYARRLELGFKGSDSLGRVYNQPPYPFMGPAMRDLMAGEAQRIFTEAWAAAARA